MRQCMWVGRNSEEREAKDTRYALRQRAELGNGDHVVRLGGPPSRVFVGSPTRATAAFIQLSGVSFNRQLLQNRPKSEKGLFKGGGFSAYRVVSAHSVVGMSCDL